MLCFAAIQGAFDQANVQAQGTESQYRWVAEAGQKLRNQVLNERPSWNWIGDRDEHLWFYQQTTSQAGNFVWVDTSTGNQSPLFDHQSLAAQLSEQAKQVVEPTALPFRKLEFSEDLNLVRFRFAGKTWEFDRQQSILKNADVDLSAESLKPLERLRHSEGGGEQTELTFVNQLDYPVRLVWIATDGSSVEYGNLNAGASRAQSTYAGHVWLVTSQTKEPVVAVQATRQSARFEITSDQQAPAPRRSSGKQSDSKQDQTGRRNRTRNAAVSPDGLKRVRFEEKNIVLQVRRSESEEWASHVLSEDGVDGDGFGGRIYWAPDSLHFAVLRTKKAERRQVTIIDSAPDDQLQPVLQTFDYTKPGDPLDHPQPYLGSVASLTLSRIDDALFANPFALSEFSWHPNSQTFRFLFNERGHQRLSLIGVDAESTQPRVIVENRSDTFVDYAGKRFLHYLDEANQLIWMSERDGWNHLYLIDQATGDTVRQLTKGEWVVRGVDHVDDSAGSIRITAGGFYPDQDPYYRHCLLVDLETAKVTPLTSADGDHRWDDSPAKKFLIARHSRVDLPPVSELRRSDTGDRVCQLSAADASPLLEKGWQPPERFTAKGRDGETDIYGVIVRPHDFDPTKKYPVLESIYAGPHAAFVPKEFGLHRGLADLADLGFIVVKIDGMGTSYRSKKFHDVCWKNLADSGFPDRIAWIKAASEKYPEMDLTRVGIWGGSAGGQSALGALLNHSDFYHAAVADCGCHDNRMDKIWWNELWMGWPVGPHYAEQSNVTRASQLQGHLMLTVGELDRNVDPASTMQVVDALIKADKDFQLIVFPGRGHGAGESAYGKRRRADFFVEKLWDRQPTR